MPPSTLASPRLSGLCPPSSPLGSHPVLGWPGPPVPVSGSFYPSCCSCSSCCSYSCSCLLLFSLSFHYVKGYLWYSPFIQKRSMELVLELVLLHLLHLFPHPLPPLDCRPAGRAGPRLLGHLPCRGHCPPAGEVAPVKLSGQLLRKQTYIILLFYKVGWCFMTKYTFAHRVLNTL